MIKKVVDVFHDFLVWIDPLSIENLTRDFIENDEMVRYFVDNKNKKFSKRELLDLGLKYLYEYNNDIPDVDPVGDWGKYFIFELRGIRYIFRVFEENLLELYHISNFLVWSK